ncbi:substrate-binding domain-containing protein [Pedobacter heparinus]|uniref:LacI family DNA-binding transcriptional regulator n=1 Tax=Pedobacter heparinus TaxID=984 RepID=UPI00292FD58E|nr:substrate-binding domain-containing protein [Pedobacter heparinus]
MKRTEEKALVGVREIARKANVSIATVDRVLHNRTGVSAKTKEKIDAIIEELNYKPNILARRLASKQILRFAVIIPSVSKETDYWNAPLSGVLQAESEISSYGIQIETFLFDQNDKKSFEKQSELVLKGNFNGVLLAPMFIEESSKFVDECGKRNMPCVFINSDIPDKNSLCYIGPDLYHSGYLTAHISGYLLKDKDKVLVVNISKEIDNHHHLLRKEEGFRKYFSDNHKDNEILKVDIRDTAYDSVKTSLSTVLKSNQINLIFVTNSRVSSVARYLEQEKIENIKLIGFDFLTDNIEYLKKQTIDFLICQKPIEQGYRGIMALYTHFVHTSPVEKIYHMPIDIITKENYQFYRN